MTMQFKMKTQDAHEDPIPPDGNDWMLGGCASPSTLPSGLVAMYWQRQVPYEAKVCRKCRAMAFGDDGNCIGCGTPREN